MGYLVEESLSNDRNTVQDGADLVKSSLRQSCSQLSLCGQGSCRKSRAENDAENGPFLRHPLFLQYLGFYCPEIDGPAIPAIDQPQFTVTFSWPFPCCVTLGKMLNAYEPPVPHLQNADKEMDKGTCLVGSL